MLTTDIRVKIPHGKHNVCSDVLQPALLWSFVFTVWFYQLTEYLCFKAIIILQRRISIRIFFKKKKSAKRKNREKRYQQ